MPSLEVKIQRNDGSKVETMQGRMQMSLITINTNPIQLVSMKLRGAEKFQRKFSFQHLKFNIDVKEYWKRFIRAYVEVVQNI